MDTKEFLHLVAWLAAPATAATHKDIIEVISKEDNKIVVQNKITRKIYEVYLSKTEKYLLIDKGARIRTFSLQIAGGLEVKKAFYKFLH